MPCNNDRLTVSYFDLGMKLIYMITRVHMILRVCLIEDVSVYRSFSNSF